MAEPAPSGATLRPSRALLPPAPLSVRMPPNDHFKLRMARLTETELQLFTLESSPSSLPPSHDIPGLPVVKIALTDAIIVVVDSKSFSTAFQVRTASNYIYELQASDEKEMAKWVDALMQTVANITMQNKRSVSAYSTNRMRSESLTSEKSAVSVVSLVSTASQQSSSASSGVSASPLTMKDRALNTLKKMAKMHKGKSSASPSNAPSATSVPPSPRLSSAKDPAAIRAALTAAAAIASSGELKASDALSPAARYLLNVGSSAVRPPLSPPSVRRAASGNSKKSARRAMTKRFSECFLLIRDLSAFVRAEVKAESFHLLTVLLECVNKLEVSTKLCTETELKNSIELPLQDFSNAVIKLAQVTDKFYGSASLWTPQFAQQLKNSMLALQRCVRALALDSKQRPVDQDADPNQVGRADSVRRISLSTELETFLKRRSVMNHFPGNETVGTSEFADPVTGTGGGDGIASRKSLSPTSLSSDAEAKLALSATALNRSFSANDATTDTAALNAVDECVTEVGVEASSSEVPRVSFGSSKRVNLAAGVHRTESGRSDNSTLDGALDEEHEEPSESCEAETSHDDGNTEDKDDEDVEEDEDDEDDDDDADSDDQRAAQEMDDLLTEEINIAHHPEVRNADSAISVLSSLSSGNNRSSSRYDSDSHLGETHSNRTSSALSAEEPDTTTDDSGYSKNMSLQSQDVAPAATSLNLEPVAQLPVASIFSESMNRAISVAYKRASMKRALSNLPSNLEEEAALSHPQMRHVLQEVEEQAEMQDSVHSFRRLKSFATTAASLGRSSPNSKETISFVSESSFYSLEELGFAGVEIDEPVRAANSQDVFAGLDDDEEDSLEHVEITATASAGSSFSSKSFAVSEVTLVADSTDVSVSPSLHDDDTKRTSSGTSALTPAPMPRRKHKRSLHENYVTYPSTSEKPKLLMATETVDNVETKIVKGGTLDALICYLTSKADSMFVNCFLTTYRSMATPELFLERLLHRYRHCYDDDLTSADVQNLVVNVLIKFVTLSWNDFTDSMCDRLFPFIYDAMQSGKIVIALRLRSALMAQRYPELAPKSQKLAGHKPPHPIVPFDIGLRKPKDLLEVSSEELARQITLVDNQLYREIQISELLEWNKEQSRRKSPNVFELIDRSNKMTWWVVNKILLVESVSDRARMMIKMVSIARYLYKLNNCNSLMAFVAGLNSSAITRLKKTLAEVPKPDKDLLKKFEALMDASHSMKNYREFITSVKPPCVPWLGVSLKDITFTLDGNSDWIGPESDGVINFQKRRFLFNLMMGIRTFQLESFNFVSVPELTELFDSFQHEHPDVLYEMSLKLEPRERHVSKNL